MPVRCSLALQNAFSSYASAPLLARIDLSSNRLTQLPVNAFAGLTALRDVNLDKNFFANVPTAALQQVSVRTGEQESEAKSTGAHARGPFVGPQQHQDIDDRCIAVSCAKSSESRGQRP